MKRSVLGIIAVGALVAACDQTNPSRPSAASVVSPQGPMTDNRPPSPLDANPPGTPSYVIAPGDPVGPTGSQGPASGNKTMF